MSSHKIAVSLALLAWGALAATITSPPTVDLGYATYQGVLVQDTVTNQTNVNFLGVRYAAAPTGILRWRGARPPAPTPGVQVANTQPPACLPGGSGSATTSPFKRSDDALAPGEDCLFLNVHVPSGIPTDKKLPVIVWIHGGGYEEGNASQIKGNDVIRDAGGRVLVLSIQYRLGLWGFLPGRKVKEGGQLNAGLLDQQLALQWVQKYIAKFGGDPNMVTIWGQSAGAGSVMQQVLANGGKTSPPLFRGAITSSTFLPSQYRYDDRIPELLYSEVVSQTNCTAAKDTLECLREVDVNALQAANAAIGSSGFRGTFVFVPVVDGNFITDRPTQLLRQRKVNGEAILSVTNTFEGTSFVDPTTADTVQPSTYISQLFPNLNDAQVAKAASLYAGLGTNIFQAIGIMGETIFICPSYYLQRAFGKKAFKAEFAIPPGTHAQDVNYYFPSINPTGVPPFANPDFDRAFPELFINFALALDPNVKFDPANVTPLWKPWGGSNEMLFNKTVDDAPVIKLIETSNALLERCNFWESVGVQIGQ